jgi:hypothetical protein
MTSNADSGAMPPPRFAEAIPGPRYLLRTTTWVEVSEEIYAAYAQAVKAADDLAKAMQGVLSGDRDSQIRLGAAALERYAAWRYEVTPNGRSEA